MKKKLTFTKMHGTGNDYIYLNCLKENPALSPDQIKQISDRHFGVGGDGVVMILPSKTYDFQMRMFNADGSEAEMCGNAVRCVAKYLYDRGCTDQTRIVLETKGGPKTLELRVRNHEVESVRVDMGEPTLDAVKIPVIFGKERVLAEPFPEWVQSLKFSCVSMGNPHAIFVVENITDELVLGLGPKIEVHPMFPARTNVEFVKIIDKKAVQMRVWERGSGETLACGTGAAAVCVACALNHLTQRKITVRMRGGELDLEWAENNHVYKSGPAAFVFEGVVELGV